MKLLDIVPWRKRPTMEVQTERLPNSNGYDNAILDYKWYFEEYRNLALKQMKDSKYARDLDLRNQAILNAKEVIKTIWKDYSEGNGLESKKIALRPFNENLDTGLFTINDSLHVWYMHPLDTKSVRLSTEALNIIDLLNGFPQVFIQDKKIIEAVRQNSVKSIDSIAMPNPLLVVKSVDEWYSVLIGIKSEKLLPSKYV